MNKIKKYVEFKCGDNVHILDVISVKNGKLVYYRKAGSYPTDTITMVINNSELAGV